jgi:multidrug efflux pump subunit AcrB
MSFKLVASGGVIDADELAGYEEQFEEGQKVKLELDLRMSISQGVAQDLQYQLEQRGVENCRVMVGSPLLKIEYTKGFPWIAVILAVVLATVVLAILIVGWRLYKDIISTIPKELQGVAGAALIAGVLLLGITLYRRQT